MLLERANFPPLFTLSLSALSWENGEGSDIALPSLFSETFAPPTNHLRQIFLVLFHLFSNIPAPFSPSQSCFFFLSLSVFLNFGCPPLWVPTSLWPRYFQRLSPLRHTIRDRQKYSPFICFSNIPASFPPKKTVFVLILSFCLFLNFVCPPLWVPTSLCLRYFQRLSHPCVSGTPPNSQRNWLPGS